MLSHKSHEKLFCAAFFLAVLVPVLCLANITVKREGGSDTVLLSTTTDGIVYAPLRGLCEALGLACRWNKTAQKLTCSKENSRVVFSEEIPYYFINDSVRQIPCAAMRENAGLCLPAWLAVSILGGLVKERIEWNAGDSTIAVGKVATVRADSVEKPKKDETASKESKVEQPSERQLIKTIVIDPGHGGKDPGALGPDGAREKDIVLDVGLKLRDLLKKKSIFRST
jgi:N-acetylmuramoyl-L-alanine amidase